MRSKVKESQASKSHRTNDAKWTNREKGSNAHIRVYQAQITSFKHTCITQLACRYRYAPMYSLHLYRWIGNQRFHSTYKCWAYTNMRIHRIRFGAIYDSNIGSKRVLVVDYTQQHMYWRAMSATACVFAWTCNGACMQKSIFRSESTQIDNRKVGSQTKRWHIHTSHWNEQTHSVTPLRGEISPFCKQRHIYIHL